jgi:glycosyltransferase involved in cell wall biosynthesis
MTRSAGNRQLRDKRPTVLVVGPVAPGDGGLAPGGVSQHVSGLIRALHSSGWRVVVYADDTPQGSGRPRDMEWGTLFGPVRLRMAPLVAGATRGGLHTIVRAWADRHRSARMGSRTRTVIAHSVGLAHAYSHARPDVVHYQHADLRPYWGMLAGIDAPEVITAHSLSAFRDFEDEVLHATVEAALRRADAVIAVSGDTSRALRARIPDLAAPVVIGNGIDVSLFQQGPMPPDDVTGPVVLYQGRIARQKGIPELIRAFATVRQAVPDATLVLVGQEEDVDVAALMSDVGLDSSSVRATGYLEGPHVAAWVRRANVVVLPSLVREGQSRTVMEAMAAGRPIVASRVGAVPSLLGDGEYGLLVEAGDVGALAESIGRLLMSPAISDRLGEAAQRASLEFDSAVVTRDIISVYRSAIEAHSGRSAALDHAHREPA